MATACCRARQVILRVSATRNASTSRRFADLNPRRRFTALSTDAFRVCFEPPVTGEQHSAFAKASSRVMKPTPTMLGAAMRSRNDSSSRYASTKRSGGPSLQRASTTAYSALEGSTNSVILYLRLSHGHKTSYARVQAIGIPKLAQRGGLRL